jgi:Flp pilus assembly protein TadG
MYRAEQYDPRAQETNSFSVLLFKKEHLAFYFPSHFVELYCSIIHRIAKMQSIRKGCGRRGVASLELGLVAPVLITICIAVTDFSIVYHKELQLSSVLTAGLEYAFNKGQSETGTTLSSDVAGFVQTISGVNLSSVTSSVNGGKIATDYYCLTGYPATYSGPYGSGTLCTDGSTAGQFISITASFTYTPIFSPDKAFLPGTFTQTTYTRLQ